MENLARKQNPSPRLSFEQLTVPIKPYDRAQLIEQLQTTLEIKPLLAIFANAVRRLMPLSGLSFQFAAESVSIHHNSEQHYRAKLAVNLANQRLGVLCYYSNIELNPQQLTQLNKLQEILSYPLRNALSYHKMKQLALLDALTGVGNRGNFDKTLKL
jgi:GGDEF domain-containing protein